MTLVKRATVLLLTLMVTACGAPKEAWQSQFFSFGTLVELSIHGVDDPAAEQAAVLVEQDFALMHRDWHAWEDSKLTAINAALANGEPSEVDDFMRPLLRDAGRLSSASGGLFNPLLGRLVALWGFHGTPLPIGTLPDAAAIEALLAKPPTVTDISIDNGRLQSANPNAQYDLGAFAKGYGIDRVIERLRQLGIDNAIVNAGGDLRAIGRHGERPWRIGVRHPREPGILASIEISGDESIFTSGDYERYFEVDGRRYHHIIDPRTGYPAGETTSVTVIHSDAATADAAATALFVAGPDEWVAVARAMGVRHVMLIDRDGVAHMNPAMQERIVFESDTPPEVRLSEPLS
jgi:thiamine biosynthesis lipoprotein